MKCKLAKVSQHVRIYNRIIVLSCRLPPLTAPKISYLDNVAIDAFFLAIICYSFTLSIEKLYAKKHGYVVCPNQVSIYVHTYVHPYSN